MDGRQESVSSGLGIEIQQGVMTMENRLLEEALKMPPQATQRVALAELILASIDHEEEGIRQTWVAEVQDRMKAVREGRARLVDFQDLYK